MSALDDADRAVRSATQEATDILEMTYVHAQATLAVAEEMRTANLLSLAALYPADSGTRADLMAQARKAMGL